MKCTQETHRTTLRGTHEALDDAFAAFVGGVTNALTDGLSLDEIAEMINTPKDLLERVVTGQPGACHGALEPGAYCAECGTYRGEDPDE